MRNSARNDSLHREEPIGWTRAKGFVASRHPCLARAWLPSLADFLRGNIQKGSRLLSGSCRHHEFGGDENEVLTRCHKNVTIMGLSFWPTGTLLIGLKY
jgi:hypothetical protein